MNLLSIAIIVFIMNVPFGYWRASTKTFSLQWFLSVHLPVPFIIALRVFSGLGWALFTFPVLIFSFFLGQFLGGLLNKRVAKIKITNFHILKLFFSIKFLS